MPTRTDRRRSWWLEPASFIALCSMFLGCESATRAPAADTATTLVLVSGNHQSGFSGRFLATPLVVEARRTGSRTPNVLVDWSSASGSGTVNAPGITDSAGRVQASWRLGGTSGIQSVTAAPRGSTTTPVQFDATVTIPPLVVHYDGAQWTTQLADTNGYTLLLNIWGVSGSSVFAVGKCTNGLMMEFNGAVWSPLPTNCTPGLATVQSVTGRSASDIFVVRRSNQPTSFPSDIQHFDGQSWSISSGQAGGFSQLAAVWAAPGTDAWAVDSYGNVRHFDGGQWTTQRSGGGVGLSAVWGSSASNVFAVGPSGTVLQYESGSWSAKSSGTSANLTAVQGSSASDVFAVGASGTILHFDGVSWSTQTSGTSQNLYGLWVRTSGDVYAVGDGGTVLHYDGGQWTAVNVGTSMNFRGIWGSSATDIFIVGSLPGS